MSLNASTPGVKKDDNKGEQKENKFSQFGNANKISAGIGGAASILDTTLDLAQTNDVGLDDIYRVENQDFSPSGTYSLMNQFNNMYLGQQKSVQDFTGKTGKDYAKGILGATAAGASAGATIGGPWGAVIGGAIGLVTSGGGAIYNAITGKHEYNTYQDQLADARQYAKNNWQTAKEAQQQNAFDNNMLSFYRSAYGGLLDTHGSDFTNHVKYINEGGTHEQNPNGGVLMGYDEEGNPNLVEEGEVIFNDYVFSARLKPSKKALNDSLIGDKYFGKTYAEIAEKLAEKSEEMANDPIEKNTLNANFARLITIQEKQRAKKAEQEANKFKGGGPLSKKEYDEEVEKIRQKYPDGPERRKKIQEATERYMQSDEYRLISASRRNRNIGRNRPADISPEDTEYAGPTDRISRAKRIYEYLDQQGVLDENSGWNVNPGDFRRAEDLYNYLDIEPMPDEPTQEEQVEAQAERVAREVVGQTPSQSSSTASATASSNPANGSGTRAPIQEGNVIRPDLTNAYVGNGQIQYDRNQNGEEFENQQYYQDFLKYMDSVKDTPEAQEWIDAINAGSFGDMNGYKINSFDDWRRLATDKKVGPVHTATLMAANNWGTGEMARRSMNNDLMQPIGPVGPMPNNRVTGPNEDILGNPLTEQPEDTEPQDPEDPEQRDYSYLLRYAPVVGNALGLLINRKDYSDVHRFEDMTANPRTVRFSPIGTYIRPNLVAPSEMSTPIQNQMAGERNYISNNSLGNSTASNNYMLASDYLGNSRIGAGYLQGKQYNAEQRQKAAAYNLGIDQYNSEGAFKEQQQNMTLNNYYFQRALYDYQMRNNIDSAYNQARSSNLTALFNNLGNIGLDTFNARRANAASPMYNQLSSGEIAYLRRMMGEDING